MKSSRYRVIAALMDDPQNRACIDRELLRRGAGQQYLCPPVPNLGTGGFTFPTFRYVCRNGFPTASGVIDDNDAEVFTDGQAWFATLTWEGGSEIGPFETKVRAVMEVQRFFESQNFVVLKNSLWDTDDVDEWPLKK